MDEENSRIIFKSYLRILLEHLKDLKEAINEEDFSKSERLVKRLIKNTQKGIED